MLLKWIFKFLVKLLFVGKAAVEVAVKDYRHKRPGLDDTFERAASEGEDVVERMKGAWSKVESDLMARAEALQHRVMSATGEPPANGNGGNGLGKTASRGGHTPGSHDQASEVNHLRAELAELRVELRALRRQQREDETPPPPSSSPSNNPVDGE